MANGKESSHNPKIAIRHKPYAIRKQNLPLLIVLLFSFLGFLDATYLTVLHYTHAIPPCTVTHGCEKVLTSQYASVGPLPLASLGIGYFVVMMVISLQLLQKRKKRLKQLQLFLATAAFIAGLGLIYLQWVVIQSFCQYCILAELLITGIFVIVGWDYYTKRLEEF